jgi:hypothetical protein
MGYDLHITRRKNWSDTGRDINVEEWLKYVEKDPELSLSPEDGPGFAKWSGKSKLTDPWLDWSSGNVYTKNPDEPLIDKMTVIARVLGAQVQGDDGEIYHSGYESPVHSKPSVLDRLRNWLRTRRPTRPIKETELRFKIGDRVFDVFRKEATVVELDPKANHGLGNVKIRYDDGRELSFMLVASGLCPKDSQQANRKTS